MATSSAVDPESPAAQHHTEVWDDRPYREFAADRGAAVITGRPSALASALRKISSGMERIPQQDLRVANELSAFFIASPKKVIGGLFATHPPMEQRIEKLMEYERELQTGTLAAA